MKSLLTRSSAKPFFGVVMLLLVLSCNGHSPTEPLAQPQPPAATAFVSGTVLASALAFPAQSWRCWMVPGLATD